MRANIPRPHRQCPEGDPGWLVERWLMRCTIQKFQFILASHLRRLNTQSRQKCYE